MAEELNVGRKTAKKSVDKEMKMRQVSAQMVPQISSGDQKQWQLINYDLSFQLAEGKHFWVIYGGAFNMISK
jgi:hypothetical protein